MTSANMLARLRTLLEESSAGFYTDAELYSALADGQREVINVITKTYKRNINSTLPEALVPLFKVYLPSCPQGTTSITTPADHFASLYIVYDDNSNNSTNAEIGYQRSNSVKGKLEKNNTYLKTDATVKQYYFNVDDNSLNLERACQEAAGCYLEWVYLIKANDIASGTQPVLPEFTHNTIIQWAFAFILRKDNREQESNNAFMRYLELLKGCYQ